MDPRPNSHNPKAYKKEEKMKFVEIYRTTDDGQELMGKVVLEGVKIRFEGLPQKMVDSFYEGGIMGLAEVGPVAPQDGEIFLEMLRYQFSGSRIRASQVMEVGADSQ